ncbi:hypothetical protein [Alloalcanivorax mobilis]|uniref:hypothetical protein n=1 Tax=Alloalcanivorax mobilis TaxID=2019569 RepID=UPI000C77FAA8|nr:hypothetical protein [Alloalcanivorax mobilis]
MTETVNFPLKGKRDYVHGTSIFNELVLQAKRAGLESGRINLTFKNKVDNNVCLIERRVPRKEDAVIAKLDGSNGDPELYISLNPSSEGAPAERVDFDEDNICQDGLLFESSIELKGATHHDSIEMVVALCKKMHLQLVDAEKKWVFSRYLGAFPIPKGKDIKLVLVKKVGTKLTCSKVYIDGSEVADIYFS